MSLFSQRPNELDIVERDETVSTFEISEINTLMEKLWQTLAAASDAATGNAARSGLLFCWMLSMLMRPGSIKAVKVSQIYSKEDENNVCIAVAFTEAKNKKTLEGWLRRIISCPRLQMDAVFALALLVGYTRPAGWTRN